MKNEKKLENDKEILTKLLFDKYNKMLLTKQEFSFLINRSIPSIDRDRANSRGCEYIKDAGKVYYPLHAIIDYLINTIKTYN